MAKSFKDEKEQFVSGLTGGSISEINWVTAVAPGAYLAWTLIQARLDNPGKWQLRNLFVDALLNVGAILLAITIYAQIPIIFNAVILTSAGIIYATAAWKKRPRSSTYKKASRLGDEKLTPREDIGALRSVDAQGERSQLGLPVRNFITAYRGSMMIVTCLAILAVDFPIFPRRFAKVETWGTSLMDIGVGSFVFSAGLVSSRTVIKSQMAASRARLVSQAKSALRSMFPLLVLGMIRLVSVKGLDYAEHVTEYGVHWNFFFTLAFLAPFVMLAQLRPKWIPASALPLLIIVLYECLLQIRTIRAYILTAPRIDIISRNREGLFSFWGYLAIFLAGQALGCQILPGEKDPRKPRWSTITDLAIWLVLWATQYYLTTSYSFGLNLQVSRRLANAAYVEWVIAFNAAQILLFCLIELLTSSRQRSSSKQHSVKGQAVDATSTIFHAYNRNGLAIFLLANLLTGLVNLTFDTIHMRTLHAMAILVIYASILTFSALLLDWKDISLKL